MPDCEPTSPNQCQLDSKKPWETPKLSMLDIKTTTLGGANKGLIEDAKTFPDS